ncbi:MAG: S9 family peptidase [Planctomycetes bacterium]|nr:S9 family peptidase [Planctomycetota bacterium]
MKRTLISLVSLLALHGGAAGQHAAPAAAGGEKRITVEDVLRGHSPVRTTPVMSQLRWRADSGGFVYRPAEAARQRACRFWTEDVAGGEPRALVDVKAVEEAVAKDGGTPPGFAASRFELDATGSHLIYSLRRGYLFYDLERGAVTRSAPFDREAKRFPTLSPDRRHVAYVVDNDLFVTDLVSGQENRFTTDGSEDILNGVHSWVYFEELYHRDWRAFWWSPDSTRLAFLRADDSPVPLVTLVDEVPTPFREVKQRYPKVGQTNPVVQLGVVHLADGAVTWLETGADDEDLLGHVAWTPDGARVAVQVLSRTQNRLRLVVCDPESGAGTTRIDETSSSWIPVRADYRFLADGALLWPSERDGFRHLYLYDASGRLGRRLTEGPWTVHKLLGVDEKRARVYFLADRGSSLERHLFVVGLDGEGLAALTRAPGMHAPTLAPDSAHFIDSYTSSEIPRQLLLKRIDGETVRVLDEAKVAGTGGYHVCRPELFTYRTADGLELPGCRLLPPGYRAGERYPVLLSIYGGPGSQSVGNRWQRAADNVVDQALAQMGIVVVNLDHRGASHLGHAGNAQLYGKLGHFEVADYADGVRHLIREGIADPRRVGIWGWSYGGYVACMALLTAPDVFTVGVAVAPVTDWANYDSIYTERYLGLPQHNRRGYRTSSALTHAAALRGKLLLMHGMMDDNVHFQNTVQLARAFVLAGKPFDVMIYPQALHGITANNARPHLFRTLFAYLETHLVGARAPRRL